MIRRVEMWLLLVLGRFIAWRGYGLVVGVDMGGSEALITLTRPTVIVNTTINPITINAGDLP